MERSCPFSYTRNMVELFQCIVNIALSVIRFVGILLPCLLVDRVAETHWHNDDRRVATTLNRPKFLN